jgi:hypothetical protein
MLNISRRLNIVKSQWAIIRSIRDKFAIFSSLFFVPDNEDSDSVRKFSCLLYIHVTDHPGRLIWSQHLKCIHTVHLFLQVFLNLQHNTGLRALQRPVFHRRKVNNGYNRQTVNQQGYCYYIWMLKYRFPIRRLLVGCEPSLRHKPQDSNPHFHRHKNLKSQTLSRLLQKYLASANFGE